MIDYHLHLWPHDAVAVEPVVAQIADYCSKASEQGVTEIAITEHLFRFVQADRLLGGFWKDEADPALRASMEAYWSHHATADLDSYVACVEAAKAEGLPVVLGLEVDLYPGRMEDVASLLSGYPFDVLLGSVHWLGTWRFDDLDDALSMAMWPARKLDEVWSAYTDAMEEMASSGACDVLAHPDLVKVSGHATRAPEACLDRIAEAAKAAHIAAELSSAGWRKPVGEVYPSPALMEKFIALEVPFTAASDAHSLADVAYRSRELEQLLERVGVAKLRAFRQRRALDLVLGSSVDAGEPDSFPSGCVR